MMSRYKELVSLVGALLVGGCLAGGCMLTPGDEIEGTASDLREDGLIVVPGHIRPLASVSGDAWRSAPRDCHGRLPADVSFELVREGLVVALDALGNPLCVDTVENVEDELRDRGRISEAARFNDAYLLAIGLAIPSTDIRSGDPSPQPSCEGMDRTPATPADGVEIAAGDPSPQPSSRPRKPSSEPDGG